eukprot:CAMPEP_0170519770 /NCGR_PEP_ID=MMETSP0209-20121228/5058_1 /TAXON_ID=665100 ORGANISM="Litonotus pictus, Strain P1" /NCGR_SAMPLE_ID=MMETSP0209 /ASSEMBLY_ACC=CAM_ASM_000301 /LENGTH=1259 /DNA_ID=CAMNT_0010805733 /DNA_START=1 /DNA_END=3783 /DNA_ORIENTATION=+
MNSNEPNTNNFPFSQPLSTSKSQTNRNNTDNQDFSSVFDLLKNSPNLLDLETQIKQKAKEVLNSLDYYLHNLENKHLLTKTDLISLSKDLSFIDTVNIFMDKSTVLQISEVMLQLFLLITNMKDSEISIEKSLFNPDKSHKSENSELQVKPGLLKQIRYTERSIVYYKKSLFRSLFFQSPELLVGELEKSINSVVNIKGQFDLVTFRQVQNIFWVFKFKLPEQERERLQRKLNSLKEVLKLSKNNQNIKSFLFNNNQREFDNAGFNYDDYSESNPGNVYNYLNNCLEDEDDYYYRESREGSTQGRYGYGGYDKYDNYNKANYGENQQGYNYNSNYYGRHSNSNVWSNESNENYYDNNNQYNSYNYKKQGVSDYEYGNYSKGYYNRKYSGQNSDSKNSRYGYHSNSNNQYLGKEWKQKYGSKKYDNSSYYNNDNYNRKNRSSLYYNNRTKEGVEDKYNNKYSTKDLNEEGTTIIVNEITQDKPLEVTSIVKEEANNNPFSQANIDLAKEQLSTSEINQLGRNENYKYKEIQEKTKEVFKEEAEVTKDKYGKDDDLSQKELEEDEESESLEDYESGKHDEEDSEEEEEEEEAEESQEGSENNQEESSQHLEELEDSIDNTKKEGLQRNSKDLTEDNFEEAEEAEENEEEMNESIEEEDIEEIEEGSLTILNATEKGRDQVKNKLANLYGEEKIINENLSIFKQISHDITTVLDEDPIKIGPTPSKEKHIKKSPEKICLTNITPIGDSIDTKEYMELFYKEKPTETEKEKEGKGKFGMTTDDIKHILDKLKSNDKEYVNTLEEKDPLEESPPRRSSIQPQIGSSFQPVPIQNYFFSKHAHLFFRGRDSNIHREYFALKCLEQENPGLIKNNLYLFEKVVLLPFYKKVNFSVGRKKKIFYNTYKKYEKLIYRVLEGLDCLERVKPYGSFANNFLIDVGDIDICIVPKKDSILDFSVNLDKIKDEIKKTGIAEISKIFYTQRYMLLKLTDSSTKITVDLTVHNILPIYNTHLLKSYAKFDQRVHIMGLYIKHWAKINKLHGAAENFLSSYALINMLINFLQKGVEPKVLPCLQSSYSDMDIYKTPGIFDTGKRKSSEPYKNLSVTVVKSLTSNSKNNRKSSAESDTTSKPYHYFCNNRLVETDLFIDKNLKRKKQQLLLLNQGLENSESAASLLVKFFEYYAYYYDYFEHQISIKSEEFKLKKERFDKVDNVCAFSIEDPFDNFHNPGRSMTIGSIQFNKFVAAMKKEINLILNGDYVRRVKKA